MFCWQIKQCSAIICALIEESVGFFCSGSLLKDRITAKYLCISILVMNLLILHLFIHGILFARWDSFILMEWNSKQHLSVYFIFDINSGWDNLITILKKNCTECKWILKGTVKCGEKKFIYEHRWLKELTILLENKILRIHNNLYSFAKLLMKL